MLPGVMGLVPEWALSPGRPLWTGRGPEAPGCLSSWAHSGSTLTGSDGGDTQLSLRGPPAQGTSLGACKTCSVSELRPRTAPAAGTVGGCGRGQGSPSLTHAGFSAAAFPLGAAGGRSQKCLHQSNVTSPLCKGRGATEPRTGCTRVPSCRHQYDKVLAYNDKLFSHISGNKSPKSRRHAPSRSSRGGLSGSGMSRFLGRVAPWPQPLLRHHVASSTFPPCVSDGTSVLGFRGTR